MNLDFLVRFLSIEYEGAGREVLEYFPAIYPNEAFYSILSRYHTHSGSISYHQTHIKLFGKDTKSINLYLPNDINLVIKKLPKTMDTSATSIIHNNTIFRIYAPFIPENNKQELLNLMKEGNGVKISSLTGQSTKNHKKSTYFNYCPLCSQEDFKKFGETYFHISHQIPGVLVCTQHKCFLKRYPEKINYMKLINCDYNKLDLDVENKHNPEYFGQLVKIAESFEYLLKNNLSMYDNYDIYKRYICFLKQKGLVDDKNDIKQKQLYKEFSNHYSHKLLSILNCKLEIT